MQNSIDGINLNSNKRRSSEYKKPGLIGSLQFNQQSFPINNKIQKNDKLRYFDKNNCHSVREFNQSSLEKKENYKFYLESAQKAI